MQKAITILLVLCMSFLLCASADSQSVSTEEHKYQPARDYSESEDYVLDYAKYGFTLHLPFEPQGTLVKYKLGKR